MNGMRWECFRNGSKLKGNVARPTVRFVVRLKSLAVLEFRAAIEMSLSQRSSA